MYPAQCGDHGLIEIYISGAVLQELAIMPTRENINSCIDAGTMRESFKADLLIACGDYGIFQLCNFKRREVEARLYHIRQCNETAGGHERISEIAPEKTG